MSGGKGAATRTRVSKPRAFGKRRQRLTVVRAPVSLPPSRYLDRNPVVGFQGAQIPPHGHATSSPGSGGWGSVGSSTSATASLMMTEKMPLALPSMLPSTLSAHHRLRRSASSARENACRRGILAGSRCCSHPAHVRDCVHFGQVKDVRGGGGKPSGSPFDAAASSSSTRPRPSSPPRT